MSRSERKSLKAAAAEIVLSALKDFIPVIALRGLDSEARSAGDLDFLVPAEKAASAALRVAEAAIEANWAVVDYRHIGFVAQLCLVKAGNSAESDFAVKIDIADGISWRSLGNDPIGEAIFALYASGHEKRAALVGTFLQKVLYPGFLRHSDRERIYTSEGLAAIQAFCALNSLPISSAEIEAGRVTRRSKWRFRAFSAGYHGPRQIIWLAMAVWSAIRSRFPRRANDGLVFGFAGMDGSGKSTQVDRIASVFENSEFSKPKHVHLLPTAIPMPHRIIRRNITVEKYTQPYSEPPVTSRLSAFARLCYYILAFSAARFWTEWQRAKGRNIIYDRSIVDFASDLNRARIPHFEIPHWLLRLLMPNGKFFYLHAKPQTVIDRKKELTIQRATTLEIRYSKLGRNLQLVIIDGEQDATEVFQDILGNLTEVALDKARLVKQGQLLS